MSGFIVSYVPQVEVVDQIKRLPHPYFPLKKLNFQHGGSLHIEALENIYQAVYIPPVDCEFKGIHLCCTAYNVDDTYDVMIGGRYVIQGSSVKEMAEHRMFETYETVSAGTPIVIQFHNTSGLEKFLLYEIILLLDQEVYGESELSSWNFEWLGTGYQLRPQENMTLVINQPLSIGINKIINSFSLRVIDMTMPERESLIQYGGGQVTSNYSEQVGSLQGMNLLARVNNIAITFVSAFDHSIQIIFRNIDSINPHPIEIKLIGAVNNI